MSWDANFQQHDIGERLCDFLNPPFRQGRRQFLNNGTNFCRSQSHFRCLAPRREERVYVLIRPCRPEDRQVFSRVSRFYPILSHETNSVTAGSIGRERRSFGPISCFGNARG